jgi:hypothetical protein
MWGPLWTQNDQRRLCRESFGTNSPKICLAVHVEGGGRSVTPPNLYHVKSNAVLLSLWNPARSGFLRETSLSLSLLRSFQIICEKGSNFEFYDQCWLELIHFYLCSSKLVRMSLQTHLSFRMRDWTQEMVCNLFLIKFSKMIGGIRYEMITWALMDQFNYDIRVLERFKRTRETSWMIFLICMSIAFLLIIVRFSQALSSDVDHRDSLRR